MEASHQESQSPRSLSLEEKTEFIRASLLKMAEHTFPFLCSVIGIHSAKTGRHIGSGLRCVLQGKRAILTAEHVIQKARIEPCGFAISAGYGREPFVVDGPVNIDPVADMAVYFLPQHYPDDSHIAFWPRRRTDREGSRLGTDYLFLHGFPGDSSYSSQMFQGVVSRSWPYGAMQRIDNLPGDLAPGQFAIEYNPEGMADAAGVAQTPVDPHGLSGSPVWRIGASGRPAHLWRPDDSLLVGIVTQWRPKQKVLVATSVSEIPPDW
jgi:hypothetical protein